MMGKNKMDERKLSALASQIKRVFSCVAHEVKVITTGGKRFKVSVSGGNTGGYHLVGTISHWLMELGFDVSYAGRVRGRNGYHVLEVRS